MNAAQTTERVPIHFDVYSVITYYLRHKRKVDAHASEREALAERIREDVEQRFPSNGIRQRLLARRR